MKIAAGLMIAIAILAGFAAMGDLGRDPIAEFRVFACFLLFIFASCLWMLTEIDSKLGRLVHANDPEPDPAVLEAEKIVAIKRRNRRVVMALIVLGIAIGLSIFVQFTHH